MSSRRTSTSAVGVLRCRLGRRTGGRVSVVLALLLMSGSAPLAATNNSVKPVTVPRSTAGRAAHVSVAALAAAGSAAGAAPDAGTNSALGAGQVTNQPVFAIGVTFTMPSFSCASSSDAEWLLPGIWIFDNNGNLVAQVDVNFNCDSGAKTQQSVICIIGSPCNTKSGAAKTTNFTTTFVHN
jgi:hypothetical protein